MVNIVIHDLCESATLDSEAMGDVSGGILIMKDPRLPSGDGFPKLSFPMGDYLPKLPFPYPIGGGVTGSPQEPFDPGFSPLPKPSEPKFVPL
jgi:hypothetical protein